MTSIIWCNKPELKIVSDIEPDTRVRKPLPTDTEAIIKDKKAKPYINKKRVVFSINYLGRQYGILIEKNFTWDGATCLGLHHLPKFLNASMVHDQLCNFHSIIDNDRQLSSMIFREICIASGVNKAFAWTAYYTVDNFQKVFGKDLEGRKWNEF